MLREITYGRFVGAGQSCRPAGDPLDNYMTRAINRSLSADLSQAFGGYINEWSLERDRGGLFSGEGEVVVSATSQVTNQLSLGYSQRLPGLSRDVLTPLSPDLVAAICSSGRCARSSGSIASSSSPPTSRSAATTGSTSGSVSAGPGLQRQSQGTVGVLMSGVREASPERGSKAARNQGRAGASERYKLEGRAGADRNAEWEVHDVHGSQGRHGTLALACAARTGRGGVLRPRRSTSGRTRSSTAATTGARSPPSTSTSTSTPATTACRCASSTWRRRRTSCCLDRMGHTLEHRVPIILYGSHNDFSQTNVTPELIDGSTGGFTEVLHNRVVHPVHRLVRGSASRAGARADARGHVRQAVRRIRGLADRAPGLLPDPAVVRRGHGRIHVARHRVERESCSCATGRSRATCRRSSIRAATSSTSRGSRRSPISWIALARTGCKDILERSRQMHNFDGAFQRSTGHDGREVRRTVA